MFFIGDHKVFFNNDVKVFHFDENKCIKYKKKFYL
jgi:ribosomal protein L24E